MEEEEDELTDSGSKKQPYYPDLHLKTAIREYERGYFYQYASDPNSVCPVTVKHSVKAWSLCKRNNGQVLNIRSESIYGEILSPKLSRKCKYYQSTRMLEDNLKLAKGFTKAAINIMFKDFSSLIDIGKIKQEFSKLTLSHLVQEYHIYRNVWESIRDIMKDKQVEESYTFSRTDLGALDMEVWTNPFFMVVIYLGNSYLLDYQQVLMLTDTISSRFMSLLFCSLNEQLPRKDLPTTAIVEEFYQWGDKVLSEMGNEGYNVIKQVESLCISTYLKEKEKLQISTEYQEKLLEQSADNPIVKSHLEDLCRFLKSISKHPNVLMEIYGCYRHFGHPTVDEIAGIDVLKTNSRENLTLSEECLIKGSGAFNRSFVFSFMSKQKRWPKCKIRDFENPTKSFLQLIKNRPMTISEYDLGLPLSDWATLEFEQEFEFEDYEDLVSLLSDTSISPYLQHWYSIYSPDLLKVSKPGNIPESRRVLVEMIRRTDLSCKKIRETIQDRKVPENWLVVALHSKEREIKIKARLFAMMCIEARLMFSMTEKNLAEKIFPYIPYQTMTWTDAELSKTLLELTSKGTVTSSKMRTNQESTNIHMIISLDFNKFNQKWRKESTYRIFRTFDELLGTPGLYTYYHEFFEQSFFYLSSAFRPPEILTANRKDELGSRKIKNLIFESETTWYSQKGGCEGLRQKGWTAIIGAMLSANEYETNLSSWIIGQGDNQVIVVAIPSPQKGLSEEEIFRQFPQYIEETTKEYLKNLEKLTKGIGMDLKLEESWVSTSLMNYGKEIIFQGSYASCSIKKISRAYQEISELYPTLMNRVASIFTSAQAAAMKGFDILVPYLIGILETLSLIDKETTYGTTMKRDLKNLMRDHTVQLDDHLKICAILLPSECGGLPILPFTSFFYRGHPDSFLLQILWLREIENEYPQAKRILDLILLGHFHDNRVDYLHLIQDPQSINFKKSVLSYNKLKEGLTTALRDNTRNPMIKELLRNCNEKTLRSQADYLIKTTPCFPRVLNEILRLSPDGSMLSFLSTFTNMRTMKGLLPPEVSHDLVSTLRKGDIALFEAVIIVSKIAMNEEYKIIYKQKLSTGIEEFLEYWRKCSTITTQEIRDSSWGLEVQGVTTPHPLEQSTIGISTGESCNLENCNQDEFILYVIQASEEGSSSMQEHFKRGTAKHYLGSGTSEKRSGPILNYPKTEKALRAAQQLLRVKNWIISQNPENDMLRMMDSLIQSRTDASEDFLILKSGKNYGGSVQHRFSDVTSKHECRPIIRVNFHSRVTMSSGELGQYSRGKFNYPILFQAHYLFMLCKLHHLILYYPELLKDGNLAFHQHLKCSGCLPLLIENPLMNSNPPPKVPRLEKCPLVFASVSRDLVKIPMNILENVEKITPTSSDPDLMNRSACMAAIILEGNIRIGIYPNVRSTVGHHRQEGTLVCLTIGFFLKIGMKRLLHWAGCVYVTISVLGP